ncbi:PAS domain-containing sensor histidine kinase [Cupriavidus sp. YR651]|uniref:PAS domain-containing sensor histidine kinase n=1 Tax=Cupriavidus sp. YR651 TaxID=1855315 RepID=UPI00350FB896
MAFLLQSALERYRGLALAPMVMPAVGAGGGLLLGLYLVRMRMLRRIAADNLQRVAESEARLAGIIRSSMEAIITVDSEQRVLLFNPMAETLFGWTAADAIGHKLSDFIPQRLRAVHEEHVRRFGVTGVSERQMGKQRILHALRRDGSEFPIEASISQTADPGGKLYTVMLRDTTERMRAEQALHRSREELEQLSDGILAAREDEKRRIARELHDDLGQRLSALKMDLAMLGDDVLEGRHTSSLLSEIAAMHRVLDDTVASVRRIASDLRPALLDELGMVPAIEWLANDFSDRYGLAVTVDAEDDKVPEKVAVAAFRIVQEALSNVVRHANASLAMVSIVREGTRLRLEIHDNGTGPEDRQARDGQRKSLGLLGIRERARLLGGDITIHNSPGQGFRLVVRFPREQGERA